MAVQKRKPIVVMEDWCIELDRHGDKCLHGRVYGHPKFKDGEEISSSPITRFRHPNYARTLSGRHYRLEKPSRAMKNKRCDVRR